jgi:hypothetical protein
MKEKEIEALFTAEEDWRRKEEIMVPDMNVLASTSNVQHLAPSPEGLSTVQRGVKTEAACCVAM